MKLNSRHSLARLLGMPSEELDVLAEAIDAEYSPYVDRKGKKPRVIDRPSRRLHKVQRKIYDLLLRGYSYSDFAYGGVPGRSVRDAVEPHQARSLVIQVDIENFYPSISDKDVFQIWRRLGHGTKVASLLTRLTTYRRHVPQGAATSMALANLFMEPVDAVIFDELRRLFDDVRYTRWVDDMIFSGSLHAPTLFGVVARRLREVGVRAHRAREKRRVMPSDAHQEILGLTVNTGVSLSRRRKRLTRAITHTASKSGEGLASVQGHLQYLRTFHSSLADQLEDSLRLAPILFKPRRGRAA